jgi:hypothetical protein
MQEVHFPTSAQDPLQKLHSLPESFSVFNVTVLYG